MKHQRAGWFAARQPKESLGDEDHMDSRHRSPKRESGPEFDHINRLGAEQRLGGNTDSGNYSISRPAFPMKSEMKLQTDATQYDLDRAKEWRSNHQQNVDLLISRLIDKGKPIFPPRKSDCPYPQLWKAGNWAWAILINFKLY